MLATGVIFVTNLSIIYQWILSIVWNICDLLKQKRSIVVNLEYVNKDVARRIIDVVSGAVHALDGHMQKISNSIVLIAPFNYDIENEMARDEIKNKLSVSWLRNGN